VSLTLSPIELATLAGAARGETVAQTAARIGKPIATVKQVRRAILDKLGDAKNMTVAVHHAHELGLLGQRPDPDRLPITGTKRDAFHAKCSELDVAHELERRTTKKQTLAEASRMFGREIKSANDLTRGEARIVLDLLEQQLDSAAASGDAPAAPATIAASA
jgi:hypothetical protein